MALLKKGRIYTVGHSARSAKEFIDILQSQNLKLLVDVRKIPKSRHNPHFGQDQLEKILNKNGIEYVYAEGLGGRRRPMKDSVNLAWRNKSFQAYADYMQTPDFEKALKRLISMSKRKRLVIMCAEAVPWRCHRSLIADALTAKGFPVQDLFSPTNVKLHKMTSFAKVKKGKVIYPKDIEGDISE